MRLRPQSRGSIQLELQVEHGEALLTVSDNGIGIEPELLPNVFVPLFSYAFIVIAVLIVAEASLSFLGLGIPQPSPTWGNMIAEGRGGEFEEIPHIVIVPATALFITVLSFNLVGERLRARFGAGKQVDL